MHFRQKVFLYFSFFFWYFFFFFFNRYQTLKYFFFQGSYINVSNAKYSYSKHFFIVLFLIFFLAATKLIKFPVFFLIFFFFFFSLSFSSSFLLSFPSSTYLFNSQFIKSFLLKKEIISYSFFFFPGAFFSFYYPSTSFIPSCSFNSFKFSSNTFLSSFYSSQFLPLYRQDNFFNVLKRQSCRFLKNSNQNNCLVCASLNDLIGIYTSTSHWFSIASAERKVLYSHRQHNDGTSKSNNDNCDSKFLEETYGNATKKEDFHVKCIEAEIAIKPNKQKKDEIKVKHILNELSIPNLISENRGEDYQSKQNYTFEFSTVINKTKKTANFFLEESIVNLIKQKKKAVENALDAAIPLETQNTKCSRLKSAMRYSLLAPAKRVRPILCLLVCELLRGNVEKCMPAAVAIEMIHTMSLVHDDLPALDNDRLRRGRLSCHAAYGEDVAILVGDALLSSAFQHISKQPANVISPVIITELVRRLSNVVGLNGLAAGQAMDLECTGNQDVTLEDLFWIHTHKTAVLLQCAASLGAVVAGASSEDIRRVEKYAGNVGLAFQIADDVLDITESTENLGKTAGKDLSCKKVTYPKLLGIEKSKELAHQFMEKAVESLSPYKERAYPLVGIAKYIVHRTQ